MPAFQTSFKRRLIIMAGAAVVSIILAACGGDDKNDSTAATATPGGASASNTPSGGGATSSAGGATNAGLANVNSYKYTLKMSGTGGPVGDITSGLGGLSGGTAPANAVIEITGSYIKPDKAYTSMKVGSFETSITVIGNQQWSTFAGQTIGPRPATASDLTDANFLQSFLDSEAITDNIKEFKCGGKENVNGVSATRCTADKAVFEKMAQADPTLLSSMNARSLTTAQLDIWLTDAGLPVRMRMDVAGKDTANKDFSFKVEADVTDINGSFQITAPRT